MEFERLAFTVAEEVLTWKVPFSVEWPVISFPSGWGSANVKGSFFFRRMTSFVTLKVMSLLQATQEWKKYLTINQTLSFECPTSISRLCGLIALQTWWICSARLTSIACTTSTITLIISLTHMILYSSKHIFSPPQKTTTATTTNTNREGWSVFSERKLSVLTKWIQASGIVRTGLGYVTLFSTNIAACKRHLAWNRNITQGSHRKILSKFTNLCNMVQKSNTKVRNFRTSGKGGCNPYWSQWLMHSVSQNW